MIRNNEWNLSAQVGFPQKVPVSNSEQNQNKFIMRKTDFVGMSKYIRFAMTV